MDIKEIRKVDEVLKFTSFTEEDTKQFESDWEHDKKIEEDAHGKEINLNDFKFAFHPKTLSTYTKICIDGMPYEDKLRFIKFCLGCEAISNACIIANLVILAQGRLIDEELYNNEDIFFEDDIEYLDTCTDLREEIRDFNTKLVSYFLASLKSMSSLIPDGAEHIPNIYYNALASYNLTSMSSAMQKVSIDYDSLPAVVNGEIVVDRVCARDGFVEEFMTELLGKVTDGE